MQGLGRWLLALCLCPQWAAAQTTPTFADLTYAEVGGQPLQLDLYLPASGSVPRPLLVWIHGGGWSGGSRFPAPAHALQMRERGFAVASISYRLSGQSALWGGEPVAFPAQIHDAKAAIRWLRAHAAEYSIDPARIAVWGSSAGGHLAALVGTSGNDPELEGSVGVDLGQSSAVQIAVDYYGPIDLFEMNADVTTPPGSIIDHDAANSPESRLIGFSQPGQGIGVLRANIGNPLAPFPELVTKVLHANPQTWADIDDPPFMIVHGTADSSVPYAQSQRLLNSLIGLGHAPLFLPVPDGGHGGFPNATHAQVHAFLEDRLGAPLLRDGFE
jgi:acetyl esterase/lipase